MKHILVFLFIVVVFTCAGCGSTQEKVDELMGTNWQLTAWSVSSLSPLDFTITANFDNGKISGKSAVNNYSGSYIVSKKGDFSIENVVSTKMAGSDDQMRAESIYHELLKQSKKYLIEDKTLILFDANGNQELIFEKK